MAKGDKSARGRMDGGYQPPILVEPHGRAEDPEDDPQAHRAADHNQLKDYWLHGEGAAKWSRWTDLYDHLRKYLGDERAKRTAAQWFHERYGFWPGADKNRVMHGKSPRGDRVGPG